MTSACEPRPRSTSDPKQLASAIAGAVQQDHEAVAAEEGLPHLALGDDCRLVHHRRLALYRHWLIFADYDGLSIHGRPIYPGRNISELWRVGFFSGETRRAREGLQTQAVRLA